MAKSLGVTAANQAVADLRRILDDKTIDAVVIATPDHWHSPAAILACEAGKHVYVEKPISHNIREGRLMVDAVNPDARQAIIARRCAPGSAPRRRSRCCPCWRVSSARIVRRGVRPG